MDRGGISGDQGVKLAKAVDHRAPVEAGLEFTGLGIDVLYITDVAVVDLLVVVIFDLHDLVARSKGPAETLDLAIAGGIQRRLQFNVERSRANTAAVHWAEHLDVADGVQAEALRNTSLHQLHDAQNSGLRILSGYIVEVTATDRRAKIGHDALIDAMGIDDDPARGGLPEDLRQAHHRDGTRSDDVGQDLPGSDRGQLIDVSNYQQRRVIWNGFRKRLHQQDVDHRSFVDHEQITIEGIVGIAFEPSALGIDFQEPVDRCRLDARRLGHPLGRAASRSAEEQSHAFGNEDLEDRIDDGCLADTRTAGDHQRLRHQRQADRRPLTVSELQPAALF